MTTKLACENGVFIPEQRIKSAIQYAAARISTVLFVGTLITVLLTQSLTLTGIQLAKSSWAILTTLPRLLCSG